MSSTRQSILEAYLARVQAIDGTGSFDTAAGLNTHLGHLPQFGPDDPDTGIVIVVQEDEIVSHQANVLAMLEVEIQAIAKADLDQPYLAAELVLGDIKRAVEVADRTLGGLVPSRIERGRTRVLPRESGDLAVGVGIMYRAHVLEGWGEP